MKNQFAKFNWRALPIVFLVYALSHLAVAQAPSIGFMGQKVAFEHNLNGVWYAPAYATWQATVLTGSASGAQSIIVTCASGGVQGVCQLADGYSAPLTSIFNTNTPITLLDANTETVTPSGVTIGACPGGFLGVGAATQCATVTATFSNAHGASATIVSGDAGIEEAITDAGAAGGGEVYWQADTGIVTLNTGGLTTTTTTKVPTTFYSQGCSARVTTTITVTASWSVGTTAGAATNFCAAQSTLTAGTTGIPVASALVGTGSTALTTVTIVGVTSNPGAGAVKARVWGWTPVSAAQ